jgi:two-component system phosphate regulon sensor histidine kinase PhoR
MPIFASIFNILKNKSNIRYIPMVISLVLLAVFLCIYLYKNYRSAEREISQQAQLFFENAFKTAEGQVFDKMMIEMKGVSFLQKKDSIVGDFNWTEHDVKVLQLDSSNKVPKISTTNKISKVILKTSNNDVKPDSLLNVKIEFKSDSLNVDTAFSSKSLSDIKKVSDIFKSNVQKAGFEIEYEITDDTLNRNSKTNVVYNEIFSGKKYFLNISNDQSYIFDKILPDILMSVLLFLAVAFAFYHIISSYRKNQELYDLKDDFMRNMTHELKTPLATMGVAIEALQNFKADGDKNLRTEYLRIAETENLKLNDLVDKVLSISQTLDYDKNKVEQIILHQLIDEICESFRLRMEQKNIKFEIINQLTPEYVILNTQVLAMVLHNLFDNAIKYLEHQDPMIIIKTYSDDNSIFINVSDNGKPIPSEYSNRIFEKFFRIPQGNTHDVKGHGLGLYIVQRMILSVRGKVNLKSDENGNHFIIELPKVSSL